MTQGQANPIHTKLRYSGIFIVLGLIVQALSLLWNHPLSFIAFITVGGLLVAVGIVLYLLTLVNIPAETEDGSGDILAAELSQDADTP